MSQCHLNPIVPALSTGGLPQFSPVPTYTSREEQPPSYVVGMDNPVTVLHLQLYLRVQGAFCRMMRDAIAQNIPCAHTWETGDSCSEQTCQGYLSAPCKIALLIEMAAKRFGAWQDAFISVGDTSLPPLDVLLIWATYLGSPGRYYDDQHTVNLEHPLNAFMDFPLEHVGGLIDESTFEYRGENRLWKAKAATVFSPIENFVASKSTSVTCSRCETAFSCPWLNCSGHGYAQQTFRVKCPGCHHFITKETLAIERLARDTLILYQTTSSRIAHSLLRRKTCPLHILDKIILPQDSYRQRISKIGDRWRWSRIEAFLFFNSLTQEPDSRPVHQFINGYIGPEKASVDLVPATLRHVGFIFTLNKMRWLDRDTWTQRVDTISCAVQRYSHFLVMNKLNDTLYVPTLGIEVVWQTHMLMGSTYLADTRKLLGRLLDRSELVEETALAESFRRTALRWKNALDIPYSTSGDIVAPSPRRTTKLTTRLRVSFGRTEEDCRFVDYAHPMVYPSGDSSLSQPCDRNSLVFLNDVKFQQRRAQRQAHYETLKRQALLLADKGKIDSTLAERIENGTAALIGSANHSWRAFGPTGYPSTSSGLIANANFADMQVVKQAHAFGIGLDVIGMENISDLSALSSARSFVAV